MTSEELFKAIVAVKNREIKVSFTRDDISHLPGYAVVTTHALSTESIFPACPETVANAAERIYAYIEARARHTGGSHAIFDLSTLATPTIGFVTLNQKRFAADQGIVISTCAFGLTTNRECFDKIKAEIKDTETRLHDLRNSCMKVEAHISELAEFLRDQRVHPVLVNAIVAGI